MSENHFAKALRNFTMDSACGDAIRHLTDKGYTPSRIRETLTFPAPMEYIASVMFDRLVATGRIMEKGQGLQRGQSCQRCQRDGSFDNFSGATYGAEAATEIVEHYDEYGRKSFLQVKKESSEEEFSPEDYVEFDDFLVLKSAQEQVSELSDHIPLKVRSTGSHRDM